MNEKFKPSDQLLLAKSGRSDSILTVSVEPETARIVGPHPPTLPTPTKKLRRLVSGRPAELPHKTSAWALSSSFLGRWGS